MSATVIGTFAAGFLCGAVVAWELLRRRQAERAIWRRWHLARLNCQKDDSHKRVSHENG